MLTCPATIKSKLAIPKSRVMSLFSILALTHVTELQSGVAMNSSSESPNLHREYFNIGSNGRMSLGNRHSIPNLRYNFDLTVDIGAKILLKGSVILDSLFINGANLLCFVFNFVLKSNTGLGHDCFRPDCSCVSCRENRIIGGSVSNAAVAGTVLGNRNVPGRSEANTESTTAPLNPATKDDTSVATKAF